MKLEGEEAPDSSEPFSNKILDSSDETENWSSGNVQSRNGVRNLPMFENQKYVLCIQVDLGLNDGLAACKESEPRYGGNTNSYFERLFWQLC